MREVLASTHLPMDVLCKGIETDEPEGGVEGLQLLLQGLSHRLLQGRHGNLHSTLASCAKGNKTMVILTYF